MSVVEVLSRSRSTRSAPPATASWMRIGELSRRVGVSVACLRVWERRNGLLTPRRTPGNQRLYSTVDETRALLMQRYSAPASPTRPAPSCLCASPPTGRPGAATCAAQNEAQTPPPDRAEALDPFPQ